MKRMFLPLKRTLNDFSFAGLTAMPKKIFQGAGLIMMYLVFVSSSFQAAPEPIKEIQPAKVVRTVESDPFQPSLAIYQVVGINNDTLFVNDGNNMLKLFEPGFSSQEDVIKRLPDRTTNSYRVVVDQGIHMLSGYDGVFHYDYSGRATR